MLDLEDSLANVDHSVDQFSGQTSAMFTYRSLVVRSSSAWHCQPDDPAHPFRCLGMLLVIVNSPDMDCEAPRPTHCGSVEIGPWESP